METFKMKNLFCFALIMISITLLACILTPRGTDVDSRTKELCRKYALKDHRGEIGESRLKWLDPAVVENFDWYQSCINTILGARPK
jgi:predicted small secreted protein